MNRFKQVFCSEKPLIGVIHLPALPGYPECPGMENIILKALTDLKTLEESGFGGALIENDGDHLPHIGFNAEISKNFEKVMEAVIKKTHIPIGLEILYDMLGTVELASKVKAQFVRLDVFIDSGKTRYDSIVYAAPKRIVEIRNALNPDLLLFTDVQVKHLTLLESKTLDKSVREAVALGSDGIIVTGMWTGKEPTIDDCINTKENAKNLPVFIGSGLSKENAGEFLSVVDGGIVASSIKTGDYIDFQKANSLVSTVKKMEVKI